MRHLIDTLDFTLEETKNILDRRHSHSSSFPVREKPLPPVRLERRRGDRAAGAAADL